MIVPSLTLLPLYPTWKTQPVAAHTVLLDYCLNCDYSLLFFLMVFMRSLRSVFVIASLVLSHPVKYPQRRVLWTSACFDVHEPLSVSFSSFLEKSRSVQAYHST